MHYANTNLQCLSEHLFAIGYVSYLVAGKLFECYDDKTIGKTLFLSGCLHDIGKLDPLFQQFVIGNPNKSYSENYPKHNEISLLLYHLINDPNYKNVNRRNKDVIKHVIYWHHAKKVRKYDYDSVGDIYRELIKVIGKEGFKNLIDNTVGLIEDINELSKSYCDTMFLKIEGVSSDFDEDDLYDLSSVSLPSYKSYKNHTELCDYQQDIIYNAKHNVCRSIMVSVDRLISSLSSEELSTHIKDRSLDDLVDRIFYDDSSLSSDILKCLTGFEDMFPNSERNISQTLACDNLLHSKDIAVLKGAAGSGKTKVALEWAMKSNAKKLIWICPRVQICQSLMSELIDDSYLPETKVEIYTGEIKSTHVNGVTVETFAGEYFSGDIVITTIDQIINTIVTHKKVDSLVQYLQSHVVFDEFHEYVNMNSFNLLFSELVGCKRFMGSNANTLLLSATPNYCFLKSLLGISPRSVVTLNGFNSAKYTVSFETYDELILDDSNPLFRQQPRNTIVISNTAITAQQSFIHNKDREKGLLFHSKFTKSDKDMLFSNIMNSFGQFGSKDFDVLRSGPIVQASLNITCFNMVSEITTAENFLQRFGRLDRFGENTGVNHYLIAVPSVLSSKGKSANFLKKLGGLESAKSWNNFLQNNILCDTVLSIEDLYLLYDRFYAEKSCWEAVGYRR